MNISSDLPTPALTRTPPPEAREVPGAPDRDGDQDDAGSKAPLKSFQGTKVDTTV
jgi:hypothetical protein